jgi:hypothetical protein
MQTFLLCYGLFILLTIILSSWIWYTFFNYWVHIKSKEYKATYITSVSGIQIPGTESIQRYVLHEEERKITKVRRTRKEWI